MDGLKTAVTPVGKPDTLRLTLPLNPFTSVTASAALPEPPWRTLSAVVGLDKVKDGSPDVPVRS